MESWPAPGPRCSISRHRGTSGTWVWGGLSYRDGEMDEVLKGDHFLVGCINIFCFISEMKSFASQSLLHSWNSYYSFFSIET